MPRADIDRGFNLLRRSAGRLGHAVILGYSDGVRLGRAFSKTGHRSHLPGRRAHAKTPVRYADRCRPVGFRAANGLRQPGQRVVWRRAPKDPYPCRLVEAPACGRIAAIRGRGRPIPLTGLAIADRSVGQERPTRLGRGRLRTIAQTCAV